MTKKRRNLRILASIIAAGCVWATGMNDAWAAEDIIESASKVNYVAIANSTGSTPVNPFTDADAKGASATVGEIVDFSYDSTNHKVTVRVKNADNNTDSVIYTYQTITDGTGEERRYWVREGFAAKVMTERYHPGASAPVKVDLVKVAGSGADYKYVSFSGEHTAAVTDIKTAINKVALDKMAYIQYAGLTNSTTTTTEPSGNQFFVKRGEEYVNVGTDSNIGKKNFYVFKSSDFNNATQMYKYNGQDVDYAHVYNLGNGTDDLIGVFLTKETTIDGTTTTEGLAAAGIDYYQGTVYGYNNEVLLSGYNSETKTWNTVWAAEITDPTATIETMTIGDFNNILNHLHEEDVKLAMADIIYTGVNSTNGSINLVNKAGNKVPGLVVKSGGGNAVTEGGSTVYKDTYITVTDTGAYTYNSSTGEWESNGTGNVITLNTGSVVKPNVTVDQGTAEQLTSVSINGQQFVVGGISPGSHDYHLVNGTDVIETTNGNVRGYKVKDDGTVTMNVLNYHNSSDHRDKVVIADVASKAKLDKLDKLAVKYEVNQDGAVNYNSIVLGGGVYDKTTHTGGTTITNVALAITNQNDSHYDGSAAVNVDLLNKTVSNITQNITDVQTVVDRGWAATVDDGNHPSPNIKMGETLALESDANIVLSATVKDEQTQSGKDSIKIELSKDLTGLNSIETKTITATDTIKVGDDTTNVTINNNSIQLGDVQVSYNQENNLTVNNKKITNVAPGEINENSTDVVVGSQLYKVEQQMLAGDTQIHNRLDRLGNRVDKVGAGAAALAALHPLDFDPDDKLQFSAGVGNYKGETAAALGAFYRPTEKVMFSVAGTMGNGENMVNAGVTFALDRKNNVSNSRVAMAHEIKDLREQVAALTALVSQIAGKGNPLLDTVMFPDVPENHWAYDYVEALQKRGIIEGYPDGNFAGDRSMTRYEYAAMLYRALEKGFPVDGRLLKEFEAELGRIRIDRIKGTDDDANKVERVRVNDYEGRDDYGSKLAQVVADAAPVVEEEPAA